MIPAIMTADSPGILGTNPPKMRLMSGFTMARVNTKQSTTPATSNLQNVSNRLYPPRVKRKKKRKP